VCGLVGKQLLKTLREGRAFRANEDAHLYLGHAAGESLDTLQEFWTEYKRVGVREAQTVINLLGRVAVVHRNGESSAPQDAEVYG